MKLEFEVENIKCGGCINSIKSALLKIADVADVSIDKEIDTIIVTGNVDKETVIAKLNELGYPEKGNNSLTKKAKSYLNCAIGRMSEPI